VISFFTLHEGYVPCEIWIVAFDEVTERLANVLDEQDALKCFPCTSETLLTLGWDSCDCWAEAMDGGQDGVVFELDGSPMEQDYQVIVDEFCRTFLVIISLEP
jgi:hypothetical protein